MALRERHVLVDRVDPQHPGLAVGGGVELAHQPVAVQDRQREVPPAPLGGGLVHLQLVVELEELDGALAVVDQPVEGRQQRRPAGERLAELGDGSTRHVPLTPSTTAGSPASPTSIGSTGHSRSPGAGDAQRAQPPLVADAQRLVRRDHRVVGVDPRRPGPTAGRGPCARRSRPRPARTMNSSSWVTLRLLVHPVELHGTAQVSGQLARRQRPRGAEPVEDVAPARVVGPHPVAAGTPASRAARRGPGHAAISARYSARSSAGRIIARSSISCRSSSAVARSAGEYDDPSRLHGHQVGARRDGGGRVDLQQRQLAHHVQQVGRPRAVQQLRPHGDAARVGAGQLVHGHDPRLTDRPDRGWITEARAGIVAGSSHAPFRSVSTESFENGSP